MDDKEFADRSRLELALIEAAVEAAADGAPDDADIDFQMQSGILEIACADGSKIIVSPHAIAKEIWVAAKSGGFHFRFDAASGRWVDTRSGEGLRARLVDIVNAQGRLQINLA